MNATLSTTATGTIKSKIIDPKYHTAELVFQVSMSASEFGQFIEEYNEEEFQIDIKPIK